MSRARSLSAVQLALLGRRLWGEEGDLRGAEPIAVVGMGMRFPGGADSPEALWDLLARGVDAVGEVPADRWDAEAWYDPDPAARGRTSSRWGGFLEDIRGFDAEFFGISPREAERMDPQQRLALEVTCEALERAGLPLEGLRGSATGVFFASYHNDYALLQYARPDEVSARTLTGTLHSVLANRISYLLGLHGPSLAVDTACSSSLVATHLACQALRSRECDLAVAGGVSVMAAPHVTVALSKSGFMSPTGRCHAFDAAADGFVRAEGCGVVVLRRLSDALASGERILGVIRGSAVNQDGESTTLSAPNGRAQEALIRRALEVAGVHPDQLSMVEAHGTGTELGDPIEAEALSRVLGAREEGRKCWLGSIKSNLGHLEAAAGVAGVVKTLLCMRHGAVPPHALYRAPNPHLGLEDLPLRISTQLQPWAPEGRRIAGVSGFGVGGTNAHVVLEEPPAIPAGTPAPPVEPPFLLPLGARSEGALRELAGRHAARLREGADPGELCRAVSRRRSHHRPWRAAPLADSAESLAAKLEGIAAGEPLHPVPPGQEATAFVFTGQGSQWAGMGIALLEEEPAFREAFEAARQAVLAAAGPDVDAEVRRPRGESRLQDTDIAQPAIFALQLALVRLLDRWGLRPDLVLGHSVGELAAAVTAGLLTLEEGARAVVERGRRMQEAFDRGRMVQLRMDEEAAEALVAELALPLAVAAVNGPSSVVLSGETAAVEEAREALATRGIEATLLDVRFAFHGPGMEEPARAVEAALGTLQGGAAGPGMVSTVTGAVLDRVDAAYVAENVRRPVRFLAGVETALEMGVRRFVEVGGHPALGRGILEAAEARGVEAEVALTLHRERAPRATLRRLLGEAYRWGLDPAWGEVWPGRVAEVELPTYPWQHRAFWLPDGPDVSRPGAAAAGGATAGESVALPGRRLSSPALPVPAFELPLEGGVLQALEDHRVGGHPIVPATALLEFVRSAGAAASGREVEVRDLVIHRSIPLRPGGALQVVLSGGGMGPAELFTREEDGEWRAVASATVSEPGSDPVEGDPGGASPGEAADGWEESRLPEALAARGFDFGPGFRLLEGVRVGGETATGRIRTGGARGAPGGALHPAWTDAAAQLCAAVLFRALPESSEPFLPWAVDRYGVLPGGTPAEGRVRRRESSTGSASFDILLLDAEGRVRVEIRGWRLRKGTSPVATLGEVVWEPEELQVPLEPAAAGRRREGEWWVVSPPTPLAGAVEGRLAGEGVRVRRVGPEAVAEGMWPEEEGPEGRGPAGIVVLADAPGYGPGPEAGGASPAAAAEGIPEQLRLLARATLGAAHRVATLTEAPRVVVVTRGAAAVGASRRGGVPAGAGAAGIARALGAEVPETECTVLDLDPLQGGWADLEEEARHVVGEALAARGPAEVAVRDGVRRVARPLPRQAAPVAPDPGEPVTLEHRAPGRLEGFGLAVAPPEAPGPGKVRIRVQAAGLNFRDVLTALGSYPGPRAFGHECAGIVEEVGPGVDRVSPGDRVVAFWPGCFGTRVVVPEPFVAPSPQGLDPAASATLPVVFGTAWYALHDLAGIGPGSTVLVHSGAGGVGMAAVQLVRALGGTVIATAGSSGKRALLRRMGVEQVFDSRSPDFAEGVLQATGGRGVDAVLNALVGEMIPAGFRTLAPGGIFLELGKRELLDEARARELREDVIYRPLDFGDAVREDPTLFRLVMAELSALLQAGRIRPLPVEVHPLSRAEVAFRRMARAEHVGKIVLLPPSLPDPSGWTVVTGGTGALGRRTVDAVVASGARRVAVWSRGAAAREGSGESPEGVEVVHMAVDVSSPEEVEEGLRRLRAAAPVTAVIHAAGIVDDATLPGQDAGRLERVLAPKALGAWNLHRATLDDPIERFVLYSAAGPRVDAGGQANYAAANAFLDALAVHRRGLGLPGVSVLWGPWEGEGMLEALDPGRRERWHRRGLGAWSVEGAGAVLDGALRAPVPECIAVRAAGVGEGAGGTKIPAMHRGEGSGSPFRDRLASLPGEERAEALTLHVEELLGEILGGGAPARDRPLRDAGLDSLGAIELRNSLGRSLGLTLPATLAFDHPTVDALVLRLLGEAVPEGGESGPPGRPSPSGHHPAAGAAGAPGARPDGGEGPRIGVAAEPVAPAGVPASAGGDAAVDVADLSEEEAERLLLAELGLEPPREDA